jgi:ABC-type nitrate/sulfonate/bicarbonate transport system ATPase subunit
MFIKCQELTYRYASAKNYIFNSLSFLIENPGFHALFGPSGVGKTTLAKIMAGMLSGFSGEIIQPPETRVLYTYNMERLPGWANMNVHLESITPYNKQNLRENLISSFGLDLLLTSKFSNLSLGQQNRINLTRYLLQKFDTMIMDESLANVDEATREKIILNIKAIFTDKTFLYISHNVMEVAKFCKDIHILRGLHKSPQIIKVKGQDYRSGKFLDKKALEHTMLEIVNAS